MTETTRVAAPPRQGRAEPDAGLRGQLLRFAAVGVLGVLAYLGVDLVLRVGLGAQSASAAARVLVAVVTTWVNARVTFGVRPPWPRLLGSALVLLLVGLLVSAAVLAGEQRLLGGSRAGEVAALVLAQLVAASIRFVALRRWLRAPRGRLA